MKGLPGTRVTGGFLVRTHNDDNVMQLYEKKLEKRTRVPYRKWHTPTLYNEVKNAGVLWKWLRENKSKHPNFKEI